MTSLKTRGQRKNLEKDTINISEKPHESNLNLNLNLQKQNPESNKKTSMIELENPKSSIKTGVENFSLNSLNKSIYNQSLMDVDDFKWDEFK